MRAVHEHAPNRPAAGWRTVSGAAASTDAEDRTRGGTVTSSAVRKNPGSGAAERDGASKSRATDPGRGAAVTVIDGNQKVARVRKSGRGMGVGVTERDHDGSKLHQRCRTGGVTSPRVSTYTPSHTSTYTPVPAKSLHINQIPTQHTTLTCRKWVQGRGWGATLPKTCGFPIRQVFLRHTCRVGSLPSKSSLQEGHRPPSPRFSLGDALPPITSEAALFAVDR